MVGLQPVLRIPRKGSRAWSRGKPSSEEPPALSIRSKRTTRSRNSEAVLPQALPTLSVFRLLQLSPTCNLDRHFHENCSPLGVDRILAILNQIHEGYLDFSVSPPHSNANNKIFQEEEAAGNVDDFETGIKGSRASARILIGYNRREKSVPGHG